MPRSVWLGAGATPTALGVEAGAHRIQRVDVLGPRPDRREAFGPELLAETEDEELQRIVAAAANELSAPIALVTLVLDQIQFFKAQYGLPADLAAARGTRRDVSFCQFVVRDEAEFEVTDAPHDSRIPQHVVTEYDIRSYLGVPIRLGDVVAGSLCVLDTKPRRFSANEREQLTRLASLVDERLSLLTERRRRVRAELTDRTSELALAELRASLKPVRGGVEAGLPAIAAVRSFLRLSLYELDEGPTSPEVMRQGLRAALEAADELDAAFADVSLSADDCEDCVIALEHLLSPSSVTRVSDVLTAAQDLVRGAVEPVGGAPLPDFRFDPRISAPRPLAVSFISALLASLAQELSSAGASSGIRMTVEDLGGTAEIAFAAGELADESLNKIASELQDQIGNDPSLSVSHRHGQVRIALGVLDLEGGGEGQWPGESEQTSRGAEMHPKLRRGSPSGT